ncbi:MAG: RluA family pseudouridine synthase, partial [Actinomycetota bacterium]
VVGDRVYGRSGLELAQRLEIVRPFLHAGRLGFDHPLTGQRVEVSEPLPGDLVAALVKARRA